MPAKQRALNFLLGRRRHRKMGSSQRVFRYQRMSVAQKKEGLNLEVKTYPMPHTISPACFADLNTWLLEVAAG